MREIQNLEKIISNEYSNIIGITVLKAGSVEYEEYFNGYSNKNRAHICSVTKSIVAILIGIAIDKGYIESVEQKISDFFEQYTGNIKIKHLLSMNARYKYSLEHPPYESYFMSDDYLGFSLSVLDDKVVDFYYAPLIGLDILSGIIVKSTGKSVLEFAQEHLFSKLGIIIENNLVLKSAEDSMDFNTSVNKSAWISDSKGINTAAWGLTLSAIDMSKLGALIINKGFYNDEQIVSERWIEDVLSPKSICKEMNISYGYLWWILEDGVYAAIGDGGNIIYINEKANIVISILSAFTPNAKDRIEFIKNYIEPIFI